MAFLCVKNTQWWDNNKNPRMPLREESLPTEIFLIDMLYSPVCTELGQTLIKLVQTRIAQQADVSVCVRLSYSYSLSACSKIAPKTN